MPATKSNKCLVVIMLSLLVALASCKPQREVVTEYVYTMNTDTLIHLNSRIDSLLREAVKRDSIHEKDSVAVMIKGDTVMVDRWHTVYRERSNYDSQKEKEIIHDSIFQTNTEYITRYIDKEVIKEVNRLYWWQKTLMWIGIIMSAMGILWVIYKIRTKK